MDRSPPGSSVHGIPQARILAWGAVPTSRGSFQPRDGTQASHGPCIGGWALYHERRLESKAGEGVWGERMPACLAESPHCALETITAWLIGCTSGPN